MQAVSDGLKEEGGGSGKRWGSDEYTDVGRLGFGGGGGGDGTAASARHDCQHHGAATATASKRSAASRFTAYWLAAGLPQAFIFLRALHAAAQLHAHFTAHAQPFTSPLHPPNTKY